MNIRDLEKAARAWLAPDADWLEPVLNSDGEWPTYARPMQWEFRVKAKAYGAYFAIAIPAHRLDSGSHFSDVCIWEAKFKRARDGMARGILSGAFPREEP